MFILKLQKPMVQQMQGVKGEAVVIRQSYDNATDAVSSAFPKGKQHSCFSNFLDITCSAFCKLTKKPQGKAIISFLYPLPYCSCN
jgi:hypothetical protein